MLERLLEALAPERLEDVVDGAHVERTQSVMVVRGHEHDRGDPVRADALEDAEAVEIRHLDVEEHEVGPELLDRDDGLATVAALPDDLDAGFVREEGAQALAGEGLVVDDEGPHDGAHHSVIRNGRAVVSEAAAFSAVAIASRTETLSRQRLRVPHPSHQRSSPTRLTTPSGSTFQIPLRETV